jgi:hypothetical protein
MRRPLATDGRTSARPTGGFGSRLQHFPAHPKGGRRKNRHVGSGHLASTPDAPARPPGLRQAAERSNKNAWLRSLLRLQEQGGYREPPLSRYLSHAAGVETVESSLAANHRVDSDCARANKKPGAVFRAGHTSSVSIFRIAERVRFVKNQRQPAFERAGHRMRVFAMTVRRTCAAQSTQF